MAQDSTHPTYDQSIEAWEMVRDCIAGSRQIKRKTIRYLPPLGLQTGPEYFSYIMRAVFFNALKRTLQAFVGLIFRSDPKVIAPDTMGEFLRDSTMTGKSFYDVSKETVRAVLSIGKRGTIIDWHKQEDRAFLITYEAEDILNWQYRRINGTTMLAFIVFKELSSEFIAEDGVTIAPPSGYDYAEYEQLREYELIEDDAGLPYLRVRVKRMKGAPVSSASKTGVKKVPAPSTEWRIIDEFFPTRGIQPLTRIPFVVHGPEVNELDATEVPLEGIADINLSHYRSSADLKNALHLAGVPTPIFCGFSDLKQNQVFLGTNKAIVSEDANAKAYFLSYNATGGVAAIQKDMENEEAQMAALGARMLDKQTSRSGGNPEAFQTVLARQSGDHSALMSATIACTQSLSDILQWVAWWMDRSVVNPEDLNDEVKTELNTKYIETTMDSPMLTAIWTVYLGGGISFDMFFAAMQEGGLISSERDKGDEIAAIENDPVRMAQIKMQALADAAANPKPPQQTSQQQDGQQQSQQGG